MKIKILLAAMAVASATMAMAKDVEEESTVTNIETVTQLKDIDKVTIKETDEQILISAQGIKEDSTFHRKYRINKVSPNNKFKFRWRSDEDANKEPKLWRLTSEGLSVGFSGVTGAQAGMNVSMGSSSEFGWTDALAVRFSPWRSAGPQFSLGVGFNMRDYKMKGDLRFAKINDVLIVVPYADGQQADMSEIAVFSITVPFMIHQKIYRDLGFHFGAIANFNIHANTKTQYFVGEEKCAEWIGNLHQRALTLDLRASVDWDGLGWYVKYTPMSMFDKGSGPQFNSISTGLILSF